MLLPLPKSRAEIERIQHERKRVAFERARRAPFWQGKLDGVDPAKLDAPDEWRKIPILDKEQLRSLSADEFQRQFVIAAGEPIAEYWRSGGSTGKPLFYPRTAEDVRFGILAAERCWGCLGCRPGDLAHFSFPIGIHPAGQIWARSALDAGIGINWVGTGTSVPSIAQLDLIRSLKPTIWMGMPSYGLHLANLAEMNGFDLAGSTVSKVITSAEPLSPAKREKIEQMWGARVLEVFGMSEVGHVGAEGVAGEGFHVWTDMHFIEVLDEHTGEPVDEGETGTLVVTPLWTNNATPFLRWKSGDIVSYWNRGSGDGPYAVFPLIKHANRTTGFFKVRGVNINHADFEDFLFKNPDVGDFKCECIATGGNDQLKVSIEVRRGSDPARVAAAMAVDIRATFEVRPDVEILPVGTLAREFESATKAPRFIDKR
jgi:phenylacetate-CoA ligase